MMMGGKKKKGGGTAASDKDAAKVVLAIRKKENPIYPFRDVAQFQEALIAAGQKLPKYGADGKWGEETKAAFRAFEKSGRRYGGMAAEKALEKAKLQAASWAFGISVENLAAYARERTKRENNFLAKMKNSGAGLYCDILEFDCPSGHECVPLFGQGQAPAGWEDVGVCVPVTLINAGYIPQPIDYVPGGFNEIFVNPQTEEVHIGGGWEFGTLQSWVQSRDFYTLPTLTSLDRDPLISSLSDEDHDLLKKRYPDTDGRFLYRSRWFDLLAKSVGLDVTYKTWGQGDWIGDEGRMSGFGKKTDLSEGLGLRGKALSGMRLEGRFAPHKWEGKILSCPDFLPKLVEIHHGIAGEYTGLKSIANTGDQFLLMGRWLFARAASLQFTVRYGKETIRIVDLSQKSQKAYQKVMGFIADSLCRYQRMDMGGLG